MTEPLPEGHRRASNGRSPWQGGVVRQDPLNWHLVLQLGRPLSDDTAEILTSIDKRGAVVKLHTEWATGSDEEIRIPIDLARVLMDVLVRHFGGSDDSRTLRKDYDAERARVDKFIAATLNPVRSIGGES